MGAQCITADCLSKIQEQLDYVEREPDLIIADYHLADDVVGPQVVNEIRHRFASYREKTIPSVIVSATPTDDVMQRAEQEKCEFMTKPVEPAELRALLIHLLNE